MMNSSALQKRIEENECLPQLPPRDQILHDGEEESSTKLTLGITQQVHAGETKVGGTHA